jgi:uncharacterized integral membrane protein
MVLIILTTIVAILGAVFATQNTAQVAISLGAYHYTHVPLYLVVLVSILVGVVFSCVAYYVTLFSSSLTIRGKESALTDVRRENIEIAKKLHQVEVENAELKAKSSGEPIEPLDDKSI